MKGDYMIMREYIKYIYSIVLCVCNLFDEVSCIMHEIWRDLIFFFLHIIIVLLLLWFSGRGEYV